jgi:hypothetical protein
MKTATLDFNNDYEQIEECRQYWGDAIVDELLDAECETVEIIGVATDGYSDIRLASGTIVEAISDDYLQ